MIKDLCPVHGIPMWYSPTDGTYACQKIECEATKPVAVWRLFGDIHITTPADAFPTFERLVQRSRWLYAQPTDFKFRGPYSGI